MLRRDQPHGVPEPGQFTSPVVRSAARLESDRERRLLGEIGKQPGAFELLPAGATACGIGGVQVEDTLGRVDRDVVVSMSDGS